MTAIREAYAQALCELGAEDPRVVVLEADVGNSTRSILFGREFPNRYFNVGIAEMNMAAMAAGFARSGFIPFVNTFATFMVTRGGDPMQSLGAYDSLPVVYAGTYCGLSDSYDGASHHSLSDIAFARSLPNMTVICPSDPAMAKKAVRAACGLGGPVYLRLNRNAAPEIYGADFDFRIGKGYTLRRGGDITIIATGIQVQEALKAADILKEQGICARVVDMPTIEPLDRELAAACARETGVVVTMEEHSVRGGLGSAVAECLCEEYPVKMKILGVREFAESGPYEQLQEKYGVGSVAAVRACRELLGLGG